MKRRTAAVGILIALVALEARALQVRIVGPGGSPLGGCHIVVMGRSGSVVADRLGFAVLDPEPELPFTVLVSRSDGVALRPVTFSELPGEGPLEIVVEAAGETLTVVSGVIPDLEIAPGAAATIIGDADLRQRRPVRLTEVLENVPGTGRSGDGHAVVPGLRGLPKHRTLMLLDDARVSTERRAGPSATFLDPSTVEEVEVIRGPGSVAYGSDAFGGIIRARSRMPSPAGGDALRYGLMAGTVAGEFGMTAEATTGWAGGGFLIGAQYRNFEDYSSPEGTVLNSAAEDFGLRLAYQRALGAGVVRAGWRTDLARDVGKPAPDSEVEKVFYPKDDSNRFNLGFERPGPGSWTRLSATIAWDSYRLILEKNRIAGESGPQRVTDSDTTAQDYELRIEAERSVGGARLVVGANSYGRFDLHSVERITQYDPGGGAANLGSQVPIDSARRDDLGVFTALARDWLRWGVAAGLRGDWIRASNSGGYFGDDRITSTDASGFLAVRWKPVRDLELTAQLARGFRDALLSDRFFKGETGRGSITGNPDLEPETSRQLDLALRYGGRRWQVAGYGYIYRIVNLIERYREGDDYYFRNRGEGEIRGVEVEGSWALTKAVQLQGGLHWIRGEVLDDRSPTDDVPPSGGFVVLRSGGPGRWSWMVRGVVAARGDRPGPSERETPGYGVLDAAAGFRISDALQLQLLGRNLLDKAYLASADVDTVLAPGRSLQLTIRGTLDRR